jgi:hypothetical protein
MTTSNNHPNWSLGKAGTTVSATELPKNHQPRHQQFFVCTVFMALKKIPHVRILKAASSMLSTLAKFFFLTVQFWNVIFKKV